MDEVRDIEHVWISMPDGIRLAARIWLPSGCREGVATILECIPYRKRDLVRARDERNHPYFAANGFACLRVDMRGSGDSEGYMADMYGIDELDDIRRVIRWIAEQSWSNGRVGMFGTSWGGTASLQAAVDAPAPLKAVLANCATCDRFEDDIHWMGGCLLTDSLEWGATLPAILACPPDSATVGKTWREMWRKRLEKLEFPFRNWVANDTRGQYWRRGSVRFDAERLTCPILHIGGWSDRYSNSVISLSRQRPDLVWGVVGPWGHHYPDKGDPGPAIGFQDLALDWWNHWLNSDSPDEYPHPRLRIWRREFDPPRRRLVRRSGEWIQTGIQTLPRTRRFHACKSDLSETACAQNGWLQVPFDPRHGACSGDTGYFGRIDGLPLEQSDDDHLSLCLDSPPLKESVELLGNPVVAVVYKRCLQPAQLVCRLCDVSPGGGSGLVTRTVANLELDEALDRTERFVPGVPVSRRIALPSTSYRFEKGHRVRLSFAASYWPLVWPVDCDPEIMVKTGSSLELPLEPADTIPLMVPFPAPRNLPVRPDHHVQKPLELKRTGQSLVNGQVRQGWNQVPEMSRFDSIRLAAGAGTQADYSICTGREPDPRCGMQHTIRICRPDGFAEVTSALTASAADAALEFRGWLRVTWDGEEVARKSWRVSVQRNRRDPDGGRLS